MLLPRCPHSNPQNLSIRLLDGPRDFAHVTYLRDMRWGEYSGLSRGPSIITTVLVSEGGMQGVHESEKEM